MSFKPATKERAKLRLALIGPSGSGKTWTALEVAKTLGDRVAVIDSERGSASKYSDIFKFDVAELENHSPEQYTKGIKAAEQAGYDVLIIDSLSHAWNGRDGALELVDKAAKRSNSGNNFGAWREVTPMHNALVDAIISAKLHVIATLRVKTEYVVEQNERGKNVPKKIGLAPVQREGVEYEFDVTADMNLEHDLIVSKTRCSAVDGYIARKPGAEFAGILKAWLEPAANATGVQPAPKPQTPTAPPPQPSQSVESPFSAPAAAANVASEPASPAQTSSQTASVNPDPKPENTSTPATPPASAQQMFGGNAQTTGRTVQPLAVAPAKLGPAEMQDLLQAGMANGWKREQITAFVAHAFPETKTTPMNPEQFRIIYNCIIRPENKNGEAAFNSDGNALPVTLRFPPRKSA